MSGSILAIDIGFSACKCVYMGQEWKFPSHIAPVRLNTVDLGDKATGYLYQGTRYVVGEPLNNATEAEKYSKDISYLIQYSPLFVAHALKNVTAYPEIIALGLPLEEFRSHRDDLRKSLSSFDIDGKNLNFDLRIYAQAVGALAEYKHLHTPPPQEDGFVIDVGFYSALVLRYQSLQAKSEGSSQYSQFGIMRAMETLGSSLKRNLGETFTPLELNQICQQGFVKQFGKKIDVTEQIKAAISDHIETLSVTIENDYGRQLTRTDRLVLAGGGAYSIVSKLPDKYREFAVMLKNPEYANARGYWLLSGGRNES